MFANRFVAVIDACSLVNALGRNTLLSLAEAELYRMRCSENILEETERALAKIMEKYYPGEGDEKARVVSTGWYTINISLLLKIARYKQLRRAVKDSIRPTLMRIPEAQKTS